MEPVKEKIKSFNSSWKQLETAINESLVQIFNLEIAGQTPEQLLQKVVETMESKGCNPNTHCLEQVALLQCCEGLRPFLMVHEVKQSGYPGMTFKIRDNSHCTAPASQGSPGARTARRRADL